MLSPALVRPLFLGLVAGVLLSTASCGAGDKQAPSPKIKNAELTECRTFDQLMPRFLSALESGQLEGLKVVIRDHLLAPPEGRPHDPPPMNDVLRAVFSTLSAFAALPPEEGAPDGQVCAATAPSLERAHPLCEVRRAMDSLVHDGKANDAVALVDPLLNAALNYIIGQMPSAAQPHYEVAGAISAICTQNANCQMSDTLDLVIGFTSFMRTPEGRAALDRIDGLVKNPALEPFLSDDGQQYGGEAGIVALAEVLRQTVMGMDDPSDLDALPLDALPEDLQPQLEVMLGDLKLILSPTREPNILRPLKRVLHCTSTSDPDSDLIRMVYRLGFEADVPEFGLTTIMGAVKGLKDTDERGTLVYLVDTLARAVRSDEQAVASAARVCQTLFSTKIAPGESRSNAEEALPAISAIFREGVAGEAVCAIDTLVYGCAGGTQPACDAAR